MENNSKTVGGRRRGSTEQTRRSIFFLKSFVKSRPIEARRSERLALQIVSLKPPKMRSHFGMLSVARWKQTLKIHSPKRFSHQYNQEGQAKPAEEFLHESMTEKEEKKRNYWGELCLEYSSHDLQQDGFSQLWLVEIAPVNLCKLLSNLFCSDNK